MTRIRKTSLLAGLAFSLLTASSLALGAEKIEEQNVEASPPRTAEPAAAENQAPRKTEGLMKPPGKDNLNPEESQPALLNPCRSTPAPRWCDE